MPHKHNSSKRHHIGKMKFKITNWREYEAGLRRRGSLTFWMTVEALACWRAARRKTRGGQARYSDLAIETALTLACVLHLPLRQTEGFLSSLLDLMGLELPVPDHTTLSRRAAKWQPARKSQRPPDRGPVHIVVDSTGLEVYGAGQWLEAKHGKKSRRKWRKLHLALDPDSGEILAQVLTEQDEGDPSLVEPLLDRIDGRIEQFTADGAYDGTPTYNAVLRHSPGARVVIPPRANAILKEGDDPPTQRDGHIAMIAADGRMRWQANTKYGRRALVENGIGRYKAIIGPRLRARNFAAQRTEAAISCAVLNRMLEAGRPHSVRLKASAQ